MTGADVSAPAGAPGRPRPPRRTRYPRCPQSRRFHGMWAKLERERTAGPSRRPVLRRARLGRDRSRSLDCGHHADLTDLGTLAGRGRSRQATSGRSRSTARPAASPTSQGRWVLRRCRTDSGARCVGRLVRGTLGGVPWTRPGSPRGPDRSQAPRADYLAPELSRAWSRLPPARRGARAAARRRGGSWHPALPHRSPRCARRRWLRQRPRARTSTSRRA